MRDRPEDRAPTSPEGQVDASHFPSSDLAVLDEARERPRGLSRTRPVFDPYRDDPGFQQLLSEAGYPVVVPSGDAS